MRRRDRLVAGRSAPSTSPAPRGPRRAGGRRAPRRGRCDRARTGWRRARSRRLEGRGQGRTVEDPSDRRQLGDAPVAGVAADEAAQVAVAVGPVGVDADDVPVVRHLAGPARIETEAAAPQLLDRLGGRDAGEVDQGVEREGVPPLAEQPTRPDQAAGDAGLERGGQHPDVGPRRPVRAPADERDRTRDVARLGRQLRGVALPCEPVLRETEEVVGHLGVDPDGPAGQQHRLEPPQRGPLEQRAEHAPGAAGVAGEHLTDRGDPTSGPFEVGHDDRSQPLPERLRFELEEVGRRLLLGLGVGEDEVAG
jgi:hypothetical protein